MEAVQHSWLINLTIQFYFGGPSFILYMWQSGQSAEAVVRLALWVNVYSAKLTYIHSLPPWSIWSWTHQAMTEVARGRNWLVFKEWVLLSTCFSQLLQLRLPCHEQSYSIEISSHSPWIVVYPHIVDSGISIQSDLLVVYPFNSGISIQSDFLVTSFISHIPTKLWPPSQITNQSQWVAIDWCLWSFLLAEWTTKYNAHHSAIRKDLSSYCPLGCPRIGLQCYNCPPSGGAWISYRTIQKRIVFLPQSALHRDMSIRSLVGASKVKAM